MNKGSGSRRKLHIQWLVFILFFLQPVANAGTPDPLPSWNEGPAKQAIIGFVDKVTSEKSPDFVPVPERIATFDNDGTLWAEQPMYFQLLFALDRVKALAQQHPEWREKEPFASLLKGNIVAVLSGADAEKKLLEIVMTTHAGITTEQFEAIVKNWIATARHPKTGRLYTEMVYQPMLELLDYLKSRNFKVFIVSGGGVEFMRAFCEPVYGVPPEQIIGSSVRTKYEYQDGKPVLVRLPKVDFINDKAGKPVGINSQIGRRPIAAFGNSDGDRQMLEWTQAGKGPRLMMLVHHDDARREWAYGPDSHIGRFSDELAREAKNSGWNIISIRNDWKQVFPFENAQGAKK